MPDHLPQSPELEITPPLPVHPNHNNSITPMILGIVVVLFLAGIFGSTYYLSKLKNEITASPSPLSIMTPTPEPSVEPSPSASTIAKASTKPTPKSTSSTTSIAPTVTLPNLDIRFGNPAANVKQTLDEGAGDGRVINREYTSIQVGEFDEIKSSWSPRITVCFHIVSNEVVAGDKVGYTLTLDDQTKDEGTLAQYDKLEAGRLYDLCRDISTDIGTHVVKLNINNAKSLSEANLNNNFARLEYKNLPDNIAPNFTLLGPNNEGESGTCLFPQYISDNVTATDDLKIEQKIDSGDWASYTAPRYCFTGTTGSTHSYAIRIFDARGNINEQSKSFSIF